MTKQGPPARLEAIVALLTPPARREEVLGDLHERYTSPAQYLLDALRTVPLVVASQIRRTTIPEVLFIEAFALCSSFFIGALRIGSASFVKEQPKAAPILIPAAVALVALRFVDAYAGVQRPSARKSIWGATIAVAFAFCAEAMLWAAGSPQALWGWALGRGGVLAVALVSTVRMSFPARAAIPRVSEATASSFAGIRRENAEFEAAIRQRNLREYLAAGFVIVFFGVNLARTHLLGARIGSALLVAGMLCVVYRLYKSGSARKIPVNANFVECVDFHRRELERQRDLLRHIWWWYLGPMIPGMLVLLIGSQVAHPRQPWVLLYALAVCGLLWVVGRLNHKGAEKLQRKIDDLNRIRSQNS